MRRRALLFFIAGLSAAEIHASVSSSIDALVARQSNNMQIGAEIINADTGKVVYSKNPALPMTPASNTKVMTAAAAYLYLGPNYTYATTMGQSGNNVYVKFSGDPTLTSADIYALAKSLKQAGVSAVKGNVVLDQNVFSGPYYGLGWSQDDLAYCYGAPISGAIINGNCMALQVTKSPHSETPAIKQFTTRFPVVNQVRLVGRRELRTCVFQPTITSNNSILLQGCLPTRANWGFAFAIKNPSSYAKQVVQTAFEKAGITVQGQFVSGQAPSNEKILAAHHSDDLVTLLSYMLKHSDDVYAGAIAKTLGSSYYGVGSYKAGANATDAILMTRLGKGFKPPYLEDGSGLSSYNLISPQQLIQVYSYMYRQPNLNTIFMKSLATSGQVGTLSYRMTQNGMAGHVMGKTGTISGVSTLSGYLAMPGQPVYIFAIMMNGIEGSPAHARYVQDQIVKILAGKA
jgi:D-alanyl-D-alanine carboxypeptidase/D-alanyl-D-alanine-endopeptidase (penicillin-binding protein 4)